MSEDRALIRELVENWVVWRDAGDWERFATVWHDDGFMMATWFQGPATEFIRVSREGFERGVNILHFLGGHSVELAGDRAISQTKMTISQRADVHGVSCDVVCTGRFYDFLEKREGRWGIVLRQPIYEKDRLDPVDPAATLALDTDVLAGFPVGYRHLAYAQTQIGYDVKRDMPGLVGPGVARLYRRGADWLAGGDIGDPGEFAPSHGRLNRPHLRRPRSSVLLVIGIVLVAANLRPAAAGIGPLIDRIQSDTGLSSAGADVLVALPVFCFGALAPLAPPLARRFGTQATIAGALALLLVGLLVRLLPGLGFLFVGTAIAGTAIATGNVLLPVLVRRHYPDGSASSPGCTAPR